MSWAFLQLTRRTYQSSDNWGDLLIRDKQDAGWEWLCYTYELPWIPDASGKSTSSKSRIRIGTYELKPRSDGAKGWRLQLQGTGHRTYIQIHRAHKSMYIEGCILPVHFNDFKTAGVKKGNLAIQQKSVALMGKIKARYDALKGGKTGNPTLEITAKLPASIETGRAYA